MYDTCSRCEKYIWHVEYKHILQPPKYLIIIDDYLFTKQMMILLLMNTLRAVDLCCFFCFCGKQNILLQRYWIIECHTSYQWNTKLICCIYTVVKINHGASWSTPMVPAHLSVLLNAGRGICTYTLFPSEDLRFGSDTNTDHLVIYNIYSNV